MNQKGFAPIIGIVVILLFGAGALFITSKQTSSTHSPEETTIASRFGNLVSSPTPTPANTPLSTQVSANTSLPTTKTTKPTSTPTSTSTTTSVKPDYYVDSKHLYTSNSQITDQYYFDEGQGILSLKFYANFKNSQKSGGNFTYKAYYDGQLKETKNYNSDFQYPFFHEEYFYPNWEPGTHTVKLIYNEDKSVTESNYSNNSAEFTYTIKADTVPPTFDIDGPFISNNQTCLRWINLNDNTFVYTDVWANTKLDSQNWSNEQTLCISGTPGESHTFHVKAQDKRGNILEKSKSFNIL